MNAFPSDKQALKCCEALQIRTWPGSLCWASRSGQARHIMKQVWFDGLRSPRTMSGGIRTHGQPSLNVNPCPTTRPSLSLPASRIAHGHLRSGRTQPKPMLVVLVEAGSAYPRFDPLLHAVFQMSRTVWEGAWSSVWGL